MPLEPVTKHGHEVSLRVKLSTWSKGIKTSDLLLVPGACVVLVEPGVDMR